MTYSNTFSALDNTDELPRPTTATRSASTLPRPVSQPDIADSGRISFGAGYRLLSK